MSRRYAENTIVSVEKSLSEIKRLVNRYGAEHFGFLECPHRAQVLFELNGKRVRFTVQLPERQNFLFTPTRNTERTPEQVYKAWEQACRQRWRALALVVKAKLEAVEAEISTFESEFLAHIVLPDGTTVGEHVLPAVELAYETGNMQPLLPAVAGGAS